MFRYQTANLGLSVLQEAGSSNFFFWLSLIPTFFQVSGSNLLMSLRPACRSPFRSMCKCVNNSIGRRQTCLNVLTWPEPV